MRKLYPLSIILGASILLCGCGQKIDNSPDTVPTIVPSDSPQEETEAPKNAEELVEEWMADETQPQSIALESTDIDEDATPLSSFEYLVREDGTAVITKFIGNDTDVVITSHIGEAPVVAIGQYAFEGAVNLQSIQLPDSITNIEEFAFIDCSSLESINIPEGVTELFRGTFATCTSFTEFTLPAQITETHEELFAGCQFSDLYIENAELEYKNWGLEEFETPCTIHAPEDAKIFGWAEVNQFPTEFMGG
ncbi:MAG: leucine-rich repeat domain-containing protein [Oscillospiraceae bacterium]